MVWSWSYLCALGAGSASKGKVLHKKKHKLKTFSFLGICKLPSLDSFKSPMGFGKRADQVSKPLPKDTTVD